MNFLYIWICNFVKSFGFCIAFVVKLWGVLIGLDLAFDKGYRFAGLCVDSKVAVSVIRGVLLQRIRRLLELE
jgi:hypothetical protein